MNTQIKFRKREIIALILFGFFIVYIWFNPEQHFLFEKNKVQSIAITVSIVFGALAVTKIYEYVSIRKK